MQPLRAITFAVFATGASTALAAEFPRALIERAERMVQVDLRYADAIALLERAVADPSAETRDRIDAYRLLGIAYVARNAPSSATDAFVRLLEIEPAFQLDRRLSPKIHQAFARAEKIIGDRAPPPPEPAPEPEPIVEPGPAAVTATPAPALVALEPRAGLGAPIVPPPPPERPALYERPWFWLIVAGAAGAAATSAILLSQRAPKVPDGSLGPPLVLH